MPEYVTVEAFETIARGLSAAGVRYLVVGGLAIQMHGLDRVTYDIDLVVQLSRENVESAFIALARAGYRPMVPVSSTELADAGTRARLIREKGMVVLNFWPDRFKPTRLDVFVSEPFDFDREYDLALKDDSFAGIEIRFPRAEILLAMKRLAARPKDLNDITYLESLVR